MTKITPIRPPAFNRAGYIATIRSTKIKEAEGLHILLYLAEKCDATLRARVRVYPAEIIADRTGTSRITTLRRLRMLRHKKLIKIVMKKTSHYQLPTESELQKFL